MASHAERAGGVLGPLSPRHLPCGAAVHWAELSEAPCEVIGTEGKTNILGFPKAIIVCDYQKNFIRCLGGGEQGCK